LCTKILHGSKKFTLKQKDLLLQFYRYYSIRYNFTEMNFLDMSITEAKKSLRLHIRQQKQHLTEVEIIEQSGCIFSKIESTERFKEAEVIMAYWSMGDEVHTHDFIMKWYREKKILLPVIEGDHLKVCHFSGRDSLRQEKSLGIYEPVGKAYSATGLIDLVIVPGIAFDRKNGRLGRGKAYYDKFLACTDTYKIGVCFNFQLIEEVPVSDTDIRMDAVFTCK